MLILGFSGTREEFDKYLDGIRWCYPEHITALAFAQARYSK